MDDEVPGAAALRRMSEQLGLTGSGAAPDDESALPVAATVVIARDTGRGPEVLMIERPDRGSFAGAWVFPGGKLEPSDREGAEEEEDAAVRAGVRETREETGLEMPPDSLVPLSRWTPPPGVPLRIRTWFFVASTPDPAAELRLQEAEAIRGDWIRPETVLQRHGQGRLTLYPPTWVTLHSLLRARDVEDVLAQARLRGREEFRPRVRVQGDARLFLYEGDGEYEVESASGARHRLTMAGPPWSYERSNG